MNQKLEMLTIAFGQMKTDQSDSVKFVELWFRSHLEGLAWLERNNPDDTFGYAVDFHIVMENIQRQINGVDGVKP